ncbi:MAG: single-stranded-DNA-specific exonuclease RecJ [Desulfovibrio sp.]|nr:single-stranded-DNA-specific exonuclease RecJ [Desulfovibrio sp.]
MRKWFLPEIAPIPNAESLANDLEISPLFLSILWRRGLRSREAIDAYLNARLGNLTRPELWPQIPDAAEIFVKRVLSGSKIAVWGDYDVDGITSTALALDVLESHGFDAVPYLPDRLKEGYGLNCQGIEYLASQGCDLLLTVDCGISNLEATRRAKELGMTVIVSDHHLPPDTLPEADAIVDPRMADAGKWPCEHLAGVGVAFYFMAAVNILLSERTGKRYQMGDALDLVALGTVADIMTLQGENRILVKGGLKRLSSSPRIGISALKKVSSLQPGTDLTSLEVGFRLAPRVNAAGRMGHPSLALNLLRSRDFDEAARLASELDASNTRRKQEEERIYAEAKIQADELLARDKFASLALVGKDWHPGVVGIVASKIVEEYNKPTIILYERDDCLKGSGRSLPDFDLYAGLKKTERFLLGFGGHKQAAGVSLLKENLDNFRRAFSDAVREELGDNPPPPNITLSGELDFKQASDGDFLKELQLMQPFGPGNEEPIFVSPPLRVKDRRMLGHSGKHVQIDLEDCENGIALKAKAWGMADELNSSLLNKFIRIAYTPRIDNYRGIPTIDIGIKDWKKI